MNQVTADRSHVTQEEAIDVWDGVAAGKRRGELEKESGRKRQTFAKLYNCHAAFESVIKRAVGNRERLPDDGLSDGQILSVRNDVGYDISDTEIIRNWRWFVEWKVGSPQIGSVVPRDEVEALLGAMWIPRFCNDLAALKSGADGPQQGRVSGRDLKWRLENRKITALWHDAVEAARLRRALANSGADAGLKIMLTERFEALVRDGCDHLNEAADQAASEATNPWTMTVAEVENIILSGGYHPNDPEFVRLDRLSRKAHALNGDIARWAEDYRRAISG